MEARVLCASEELRPNDRIWGLDSDAPRNVVCRKTCATTRALILMGDVARVVVDLSSVRGVGMRSGSIHSSTACALTQRIRREVMNFAAQLTPC